jgi:hypothetical protein
MRSWYFDRRAPLESVEDIVAWWEIRRIPYNGFVAVFGVTCFVIYGLALLYVLEPDPPDFVEPVALMAAPFMINFAYTLGWIVELSLRQLGWPNRDPLLMKLGMAATVFFIALPAVSWGLAAIITATYRLTQS